MPVKELIYPHTYGPAMDQYGEAEGIVDGNYRSSWNAHTERVSRLCHALEHQLRVAPSDRFAVLALNSHQYLELWHAAFMGAGVINPLNLRLAPKELAYIVSDSGTEVVFTDPAFAPLVAAARAEMGDADPIRKVVLTRRHDHRGAAPRDLSHADADVPRRLDARHPGPAHLRRPRGLHSHVQPGRGTRSHRDP
jgi:acyl-CoA synthetase (AMP-forming)/AMP-acid ligase II